MDGPFARNTARLLLPSFSPLPAPAEAARAWGAPRNPAAAQAEVPERPSPQTQTDLSSRPFVQQPALNEHTGGTPTTTVRAATPSGAPTPAQLLVHS